MRWKILLFSKTGQNTDRLLQDYARIEKYCDIVPTQNVEETIENYLCMQSEIVIVCSDVTGSELRKLKSVLHHIDGDIVIIENFDFNKYNIREEIKKAIHLYNTSNTDLFKTKFSTN